MSGSPSLEGGSPTSHHPFLGPVSAPGGPQQFHATLSRYNVYKIHWLMAALAFTKSISLLFHSVSTGAGAQWAGPPTEPSHLPGHPLPGCDHCPLPIFWAQLSQPIHVLSVATSSLSTSWVWPPPGLSTSWAWLQPTLSITNLPFPPGTLPGQTSGLRSPYSSVQLSLSLDDMLQREGIPAIPPIPPSDCPSVRLSPDQLLLHQQPGPPH